MGRLARTVVLELEAVFLHAERAQARAHDVVVRGQVRARRDARDVVQEAGGEGTKSEWRRSATRHSQAGGVLDVDVALGEHRAHGVVLPERLHVFRALCDDLCRVVVVGWGTAALRCVVVRAGNGIGAAAAPAVVADTLGGALTVEGIAPGAVGVEAYVVGGGGRGLGVGGGDGGGGEDGVVGGALAGGGTEACLEVGLDVAERGEAELEQGVLAGEDEDGVVGGGGRGGEGALRGAGGGGRIGASGGCRGRGDAGHFVCEGVEDDVDGTDEVELDDGAPRCALCGPCAGGKGQLQICGRAISGGWARGQRAKQRTHS